MEVGSIARTASPGPNAPVRVENAAAPSAARTELRPEESVQQAGRAEAVRVEIGPSAADRAAIDRALQETIDRRIEIDPESRMVVYQAVDKRTGDVVRQVPDQALMRLRAYAREMREKVDDGMDWETRRVEKIA